MFPGPGFDDIHIAADIFRIYIAHFEAFSGTWDEFIKRQVDHRNLLIKHPGEFGVDPKLGGLSKIVKHIFEAYFVSDITYIVMHLHHTSQPESRIGDFIEYGWTRGQHSVFNAEVRLTIIADAIAGSVPAIYCTVVNL